MLMLGEGTEIIFGMNILPLNILPLNILLFFTASLSQIQFQDLQTPRSSSHFTQYI